MSIRARIYQPAKNAMQSGRGKTRRWVFEYGADVKNAPEPLMGWNAGGTLQQIRLEFDSLESATTYAKKKGVEYDVIQPKAVRNMPRAYAANFAYNKRTAF